MFSEKHDIMFEILHKLNPFDPIKDPETSDIMLILLSMPVLIIITMTKIEQKTIQIVP